MELENRIICQITFGYNIYVIQFTASHFNINKENKKYLVSSIQVASEKTVQRGRVAPLVTSIPTNSGN